MVKRGIEGYLKLLSKKDVKSVHNAVLDVLGNTGIECYSERILKIFDDAGADIIGNRVRIPEYLVNDAVRDAPSKILFCGRNPKNDILLEGTRIYYGYGGSPTPFILDHRTGEYRRPTKKDMIETTLVGDALPNMDYMMANAGVFDVPYEVEYLHELDVLLNYTEKPILYSAPGSYLANKYLEMAIAVAGGLKELQRRPFLILYTEPSSPLMLTNTQENIIEFAKANIPIAIGPMPLAGGTAPGTLIGSAVIGTAETLAGIVLAELVNPHAPVIFGGWGLTMDPRSGICTYGAPEFAIGANTITAQMAQFYGIPSYGFGGCTDGKQPDSQSGAESMLNALIAGQSGVNLIHDCGYLAGGIVGSVEQAVIVDDIVGIAKKIVEGVKVDDDHLAVDVINDVGPGGSYIAHHHTLDHVNEFFLPNLFDRTSFGTWQDTKSKDIRTLARQKVDKILKEHKPEPLKENIKQKLSEIIKEGEKYLIKG